MLEASGEGGDEAFRSWSALWAWRLFRRRHPKLFCHTAVFAEQA